MCTCGDLIWEATNLRSDAVDVLQRVRKLLLSRAEGHGLGDTLLRGSSLRQPYYPCLPSLQTSRQCTLDQGQGCAIHNTMITSREGMTTNDTHIFHEIWWRYIHMCPAPEFQYH